VTAPDGPTLADLLVPAPVLLPLAGAALSLALTRRPLAQRAVSSVVLAAVLAADVALLLVVRHRGTVVTRIGAWPPPFGITLVADLLAAIMLVLAAVTLLAVFVYAIGQGGAEEVSRIFHPIYLLLAAGLALAFVTGDLFNLFVAIEVTLAASYVLVGLDAGPGRVLGAMTYVVSNLIASTLFITAIGLIYAATGTLNLADLARRVGLLPPGLRLGLGLLLVVVFGIKAAIFPLFFWLPDSYPVAPGPVTAVFAGLLTKVGLYAIVRTQTLVFSQSRPSTALLVLAVATMVAGCAGAVAQDDLKRMLSFTIVGHVGYLLFGLALFTVAGLAGMILYVIHHVVVQTALFLVEGLVESSAGTGSLFGLAGILHARPLIALLFAPAALSLAGMPPFSGFVAKLALVEAGLAAGAPAVVAASLLAGLLTLLAMARAWGGAFLGRPVVPVTPPPEATAGARPAEEVGRPGHFPRLMELAAGSLVVLSLTIAVGAGPLYRLSERAAAGLLQPAVYESAVLER
jgi:multicomponent Na+:H+ antiporter subunit D